MGAISKLIGAGLKKAAKKTKLIKEVTVEVVDPSTKTVKELEAVLNTLHKASRTKSTAEQINRVGKQLDVAKAAAKVKANSMRDAGLGGAKKQATRKTKPNKALQNKASKEGKTDAEVQALKRKQGPKQKRLNKVGIGTKKDLQKSNPGAYDELNQNTADELKTLRSKQKGQATAKKAPNKSSKMQSTDFVKKGLGKGKQATKKKKSKAMQDAAAIAAGAAGGAAVHQMTKKKKGKK